MSTQPDVTMRLSTSSEPTSNGSKTKHFDQSPKDAENYETQQDEEPDPGEDTSDGYISTKDYAYDQSNPLHYGYLQNAEEYYDDDEEDEVNDEELDQNKRQSIILPKDYLINQLAVALYDFEPENDNELGLREGDVVFISYRHGQGWLVAENQERTKTGLVPEDFVTYLDDSEDEETAETARPFYLTQFITQGLHSGADSQRQEEYDEDEQEDDGEWEDVGHLEEQIADKLTISKK